VGVPLAGVWVVVGEAGAAFSGAVAVVWAKAAVVLKRALTARVQNSFIGVLI
jgi:hypothetical protein